MSYAQHVKHSGNARKRMKTRLCIGQHFNPSGQSYVPTKQGRSSASRAKRDYRGYRNGLALTLWRARREGCSNAELKHWLIMNGHPTRRYPTPNATETE